MRRLASTIVVLLGLLFLVLIQLAPARAGISEPYQLAQASEGIGQCRSANCGCPAGLVKTATGCIDCAAAKDARRDALGGRNDLVTDFSRRVFKIASLGNPAGGNVADVVEVIQNADPGTAGGANNLLKVTKTIIGDDEFGVASVVSEDLAVGAAAEKLANEPDAPTGYVPPGIYDFYWVTDYQKRESPLLLAQGIKVRANEVAEVGTTSGIRLEVADWVPARDKNYGWWGAPPAGAGPEARVQWTNANDALLLAPGAYDVYWAQDYETSAKPLLLAMNITVATGQAVNIRADSGIKIEVGDWVPARDKNYGWWGAAPAGAGPKARVNWTKTNDALLLAPGAYDVYWAQDYETSAKPLLIAANVTVAAGQATGVRADSGLAVKLPEGTPAMDENYGWWGVTAPGADANERIHWSKGRFDLPLLLPPRAYDVFWKPNYESVPERKAQSVTVTAGQLVEVDLGAAELATRVITEAEPPASTTSFSSEPATAAAPNAAATAASKSVITSFSVRSSESTRFGADFPEGIHRVEAVYEWQNAPEGYRVGIHWSKGGAVILEQGETLTKLSGSSTWYLQLSGGSSLPVGEYQVALLENGQALTPPMPFSIGIPAAGAEEMGSVSVPQVATDPQGFAVPALEGFEKQFTHQTDASPAIEGEETTVEVFASPNRDKIFRFSVGSVVWGYAWLPKGDATQGYFLRDPQCNGLLTEKWAPDAPFSAPDCAVAAIAGGVPEATFWSSRGWQRERADTYVNPGHGLRVVVPAGWTIMEESDFDPDVLWVMRKLGADGQPRLMLSVRRDTDGQKTDGRAWFESQLAALRSSTVKVGGESKPVFDIDAFGETDQPGIYEVWQTMTNDGRRLHVLYFVRNGTGYVVTRGSTSDVTDDEIAELETIRDGMALQ